MVKVNDVVSVSVPSFTIRVMRTKPLALATGTKEMVRLPLPPIIGVMVMSSLITRRSLDDVALTVRLGLSMSFTLNVSGPTGVSSAIVWSAMLLMVGGSLISIVLFGWAAPLLYWIGPQLLGQPLLRAYLLAEHTGCSEDRNGLTNTRTTLTWWPVRLLMWDMPYHAEHHLFPSIPFHRLADAHRLIGTKLGVVQAGYVRWNWKFVRSLAGVGRVVG